ncbi:regulatory protein GemA [Sphingomonas sp. SORGH_AS_0879]|uniref:regulatory protein GemA n=1 Tax=Sphingomonas sp. SORGH_AS_0879 TaxID=3041790 RepID=UPI002786580D|nr:regulatory protein GemA [Sphingomonas sp. SORGH_AS_0879]MDQ1229300.1 phage gp16-like protein [Sphingomonas sp. SORGH_AS_0879]
MTVDPMTARRRAIFAAARDAGLDEDDRRAVQLRVTGKPSLTGMTLTDMDKVLTAIRGNGAARSARPVGSTRAHVGKIWALWWSLYWLRAVECPEEKALNAWVKRQTGVDAVRFLDHKAAIAVIEAMKAWAAREGVEWSSPPCAQADRRAVLDAIWAKLLVVNRVEGRTADAFLRQRLNLPAARWTDRQTDEAIKLLGRMLRGGDGNG